MSADTFNDALPPQKHMSLGVGIHTDKLIPKDSPLRQISLEVIERIKAQIPEDAHRSYVWGMADLTVDSAATVRVLNTEVEGWPNQDLSGEVTNVRLVADFCSAMPESITQLKARVLAIAQMTPEGPYQIVVQEEIGTFNRRGEKILETASAE